MYNCMNHHCMDNDWKEFHIECIDCILLQKSKYAYAGSHGLELLHQQSQCQLILHYQCILERHLYFYTDSQ